MSDEEKKKKNVYKEYKAQQVEKPFAIVANLKPIVSKRNETKNE